MEIVKKNLVSIICGVVALIAVALHFYPVSGWFSDLQQRANARAGVYGQLQGLLTKERYLPVVSLEQNVEPKKLEQFPTDAVIRRAKQVSEAMDAEAKALFQAAVKVNRGDKVLFLANTLPTYTRTVQQTIKPQYVMQWANFKHLNPAMREKTLPMTNLKAGMVPTADEIAREIKLVGDTIRREETVWDGNKALNQEQVSAKVEAETAKVPEALRQKVAQNCVIYLDPESLEVHAALIENPTQAPRPEHIFWAQMNMWLQLDVLKGIAEANSGSKNVTESPVKRIVKLAETGVRGGISTAAPRPTIDLGGMDDSGMSTEPTGDLTQPLPKNYAISVTGRTSNPLYDVMPFDLSLIVDAEKIPHILQSLSRSRFLTVTQANVTPVDSGAAQAEGYIYGTRPVVQLDLKCEALFMREWTKEYMPDPVKRSLGIVDPPPQVTMQ